MQFVRRIDPERSSLVGFGVRTLLVSADNASDDLSNRLAGLGASVVVESEFYNAIDQITQEPTIYNLCVINCDSFGGLESGRRFIRFLGDSLTYMPVILLSQEVKNQHFSDHHMEPTMLRLPLSSVAARVGFEHSMRERFVLRAS